MYRAVALAAHRRGLRPPFDDPATSAALVALAEECRISLTGSLEESHTILDGEDVSSQIRVPEISRLASQVSAIPGVRRRLSALQRELALEGGGVLEGRDIATRVVPEAPFRFFLTASPEVRAQRRFAELSARASAEAKGPSQTLAEVLADQEARDLADATRTDSPLVCDERYDVVDTSGLSPEGALEVMLRKIRGEPAAGG